MISPIDLVIDRLDAVRRSGDSGHQWTACCPAHDDAHQSLSIGVDKRGVVLLHCHTGCEASAVLAALGLTFADLRPEGASRDILPFRRPQSSPRRQEKTSAPKTAEDLNALLLRCEIDEDCRRGVARFATQLGVRPHDLWALGCRWKRVQLFPKSNSDPGELWYPERDARGNTVGICIRQWNGRKSEVPGSRRGLCYAAGILRRRGAVYLPEGMTNTAALMAMGLCAIGRPSNSGGAELLIEMLSAESHKREIIVLANNDQREAVK